ncbi:MAG: methyltransferase domain-containing protein [Rhodospirillales bacterium]|nr:methyltransferase domain-containing protein [Rhodospirillales bacterium]
MNELSGLRAVPLYTHVDRITRGLAARGIGSNDAIPPDELFALDQWHYHGTDAIRDAAGFLGLGSGSRVLDIGAGIGGPARFLAHATGCHVTALELQPELHRVGVDLTRRSGLADRVTHVCGNALSQSLSTAAFDAVISFLAILHIPDRPALMKRVQTVLRPGGQCYIEDLARRAPFAPHDREDLLTVVQGVALTSIEDYAADLRQAGLVDVVATDTTNDWALFAAQRLADWRRDRVSYAAVHGEEAWEAQERFYSVIDRLYRSGSLGGVRLTARA